MERLQAEEMEHPSSNLVNDGVILPHETREVSYPPCKVSTRGCAFFNLFVCLFVYLFVLFVCLLVCFVCLFSLGSVSVFRSVFEVSRATGTHTVQTLSKCAANVIQLVSEVSINILHVCKNNRIIVRTKMI